MVNRAKDKGTYAESLVVKHLVGSLVFPGAHRSALSGSNDIGDIIGCRDFTIQVKNCQKMSIPAWLRDTEEQRLRGNQSFGVLVVKKAGFGASSVGKWHALMLGEQWKHLWREAGKPVVNMWYSGKDSTEALGWHNLGLDVVRVHFRSGIEIGGDDQFRVMSLDGFLDLARRRIGRPENFATVLTREDVA